MTVTFQEPSIVDVVTVRLKFTSDQATPVTFRVYVMGRLVTIFVADDGYGEFDLNVAEDEQPYVQILDDEVSREDYAYPGQVTLAWQAKAGATSYRIEEYVSAVWTERYTVVARGEGAFTYLTRWLEDAVSYQWRIIPIGANGNDGSPLTFAFTFVRHPDVPDVTYPIDSGGNLVVTAA